MKKFLTGILAFAMMLSVLVYPGLGTQKALAAGVTFSVTASPTSVASGGEDVEYSFNVANNMGETISDVTITLNSTSPDGIASMSAVTLGSIGDGNQENPSRTVKTKPGTLSFKLSYKNSSGTAQTPITKTVTITQKASTPQLAFDRDPDKTVVEKNGTVNVTYTLQNNSDESITALTLKDNFSTVAIASGLTLAANSEQKVYTKTYTITKDIVSAPTVSYKYLGKSYTKTLDALTIKIGTAAATVSTTSDKTSASNGDSVKFTTTIKNTGTSSLSDLTLYDSDNNSVANGISLAAGETKTIDTNITMTSDKNVFFTLKGKDSNGSSIEIKGNTINITLSDPVTEGLQVTASADSESISSGTPVKFTFTVKNTSSGVIKNISVGEEDAEEALTSSISSLAAGASATLTATIDNIYQTTDFNFVARGTNTAGKDVEVASNSIRIVVDGAAETPVATDSLGARIGPISTLFTIFIVIIVLIVISVIVLLVLVSKEKKKKKLIAAQRSKQQMQQKRPGMGNGPGNNGNNGKPKY